MKKIILSVVIASSLSSSHINADAWQTTKEYTNKAMFWKSAHLEDIDFKSIYPLPIYKKSYFSLAITATAIASAGAFIYFTAGAGAPAAAAGTSTVASWVAGGGAGSYMAGLSTIGSWFGGNAILGAAILNGISLGTIGAGSAFTTLSLLGKVSVMASVTAMGLDGVAYFSNPTTNRLEYKVKVTIPRNLGSKDTRKLIDNIYETKNNIIEALEEEDSAKQKAFLGLNREYNKNAITLLNTKLTKENNQEDLIVLSVIAWNNSEYELFDKAISQIDISKLNNTGFLNYLYALQNLHNGDLENSLAYLDSSINEDPYAIEPNILYINILGNQDFINSESKIKSLVKSLEEHVDSDKYASEYTLTSIYYRVATFYFINKKYVQAKNYYKKAYKELGIIQHTFNKQVKHTIQLGIANSLYAQKKKVSADSTYQNILDDISKDNLDEKNLITTQYLGNEK